MALFHLNVTQIKRSKGQSAIAAAAYRAGEKLHSDYYGETSDYTHKNGVICSEILLPDHAPREYADGNYIFNAVPTTDWGSPETLEYWREQWAALCNAKFEEKGNGGRIDHRSYERQGIDLLPTIHEGPAVRQMEAKGIRTDKGEFNRWIKATNALIRSVRKKIAALLDWLKEAKEELSKPLTPDLISLLQIYFNQRNAGDYSQKARANNLKELSEIITFLQEHGITDVESLKAFVIENT